MLKYTYVCVVLMLLMQQASAGDGGCRDARFYEPAKRNSTSGEKYRGLVFNTLEHGWRLYSLQMQKILGTSCAYDTEVFARKVAEFQKNHQTSHQNGIVDRETLFIFKDLWQKKRKLYHFATRKPCPFKNRHDLVGIGAVWSLGAYDPRLDQAAFFALQAMRKKAIEDGVIEENSKYLKVVGAYRSLERAKALVKNNPNPTKQAVCSVHVSGYAVDIFVGNLPQFNPISSVDENRYFQTQQKIYAWLVDNAEQFGFVNLVYEPWHWEYVGKNNRLLYPHES